MAKKLMRIGISVLLLGSGCSGGGGGGVSCSGASDTACIDAEYCLVSDFACAGGGSCQEIPESCPSEVSTVCSCDGLTFINECYAAQAGQSVAASGECA